MQKAVRRIATRKLVAFLKEFSAMRAGVHREPEVLRAQKTIDTPRLVTTLSDFWTLRDVSMKRGDLMNVWSQSGLGRDEVRNSAVLAWLFDAQGSHGLGASVLDAFCNILEDRHKGKFPVPVPMQDTYYSVMTEAYQLANSENRIDIALDGSNFTVFIEVKIDAVEGDHQLERYLKIAYEKARQFGHEDSYAVIYLTTERHSEDKNRHPNLVYANWGDIAQSISIVLRARSNPEHHFTNRVLRHFRQHIARF